jgi:hypothetical protein
MLRIQFINQKSKKSKGEMQMLTIVLLMIIERVTTTTSCILIT